LDISSQPPVRTTRKTLLQNSAGYAKVREGKAD
jgi:hypothetical protein